MTKLTLSPPRAKKGYAAAHAGGIRATAEVGTAARCAVFLYEVPDAEATVGPLDTPIFADTINPASAAERARLVEMAPAELRDDIDGALLDLAAQVSLARLKRSRERAGEEPAAVEEEPLEPWPHAVDGAALLDDLRSVLARYLVLPASAPEAIALWLAHTYALDVAQYTPYLLITSPVRECGKSTLLELLFHLAQRARRSSGITAAALYRLIDKHAPTMLLDELDTRFKSDGGEALRGVLNAGFERGGRITVCVGDDHEPRDYNCFSAKALAGIGRPWDTVVSRSIPLRMRRASPGERVGLKKIRGDRIAGECESYRRRLLRWVADERETLADADPVTPGALGARQSDVWRPLLAIADAAGGHWPETARAAALTLHGVAEDEGDIGLLLLEDLHRLFVDRGADRLFSHTVAEELEKMEGRPWPEYHAGKPLTKNGVAKILRRFDVHPKLIREHTDVGRGYDLADLAPVFRMYLPQPDADTTPTEAPVTAVTLAAGGEGATHEEPDVVTLPNGDQELTPTGLAKLRARRAAAAAAASLLRSAS